MDGPNHRCLLSRAENKEQDCESERRLLFRLFVDVMPVESLRLRTDVKLNEMIGQKPKLVDHYTG